MLKFGKSLFICPRFSMRLANGLPPNLVGTNRRAWDVSLWSPIFTITYNYGNIRIIMSLFLHHDVTRLLTRPETDLSHLYKHKRYVTCNGMGIQNGYNIAWYLKEDVERCFIREKGMFINLSSFLMNENVENRRIEMRSLHMFCIWGLLELKKPLKPFKNRSYFKCSR